MIKDGEDQNINDQLENFRLNFEDTHTEFEFLSFNIDLSFLFLGRLLRCDLRANSRP